MQEFEQLIKVVLTEMNIAEKDGDIMKLELLTHLLGSCGKVQYDANKGFLFEFVKCERILFNQNGYTSEIRQLGEISP